MEGFSNELMSQLQSKVSFTIPIFGGIPVATSVVITWGIMLFLFVLVRIFVRNLKMIPTGPQVYIEAIVGGIYGFFKDILGEEGKRYIPYLGTVAIYLVCANLIGVLGITPPTKDLNTTAGLALMSFFLDRILRNKTEKVPRAG